MRVDNHLRNFLYRSRQFAVAAQRRLSIVCLLLQRRDHTPRVSACGGGLPNCNLSYNAPRHYVFYDEALGWYTSSLCKVCHQVVLKSSTLHRANISCQMVIHR